MLDGLGVGLGIDFGYPERANQVDPAEHLCDGQPVVPVVTVPERGHIDRATAALKSAGAFLAGRRMTR
jgi:hypothetical protein